MNVEIQGSIVAGPSGGGDCAFPGATTNIVWEEMPGGILVATYNAPSISSPSVYVALAGVGAGQSVSQGTILYLRTRDSMRVRLTQYLSTGDIVSELFVKGPCLWRFPAENYLKLLEAMGTGTIEYFVAGAI